MRPACTPAQPKARYDQLDVLRGLACLAVVAFHYLHRGQRDGWITQHSAAPVNLLASYGYLGVQMFFIISGFVIFMSADGTTLRGFIASRIARLYPALWAGVLLTSLTVWWAHNPYFGVTLGQVLVNLTMVPQWLKVEFVDGAYWSLAVELQFYLIIIVVKHWGWMARPEPWMAAWLLIASLNAVRPMYPLEFWLDARWASLFVAGMLFCCVARTGWSAPRVALMLWSYGLTLWYGWQGASEPALSDKQINFGQPLMVLTLLTAFHLPFLAVTHGRLKLRPSPLVTWFGVLTYPVYLLHQNIGYILLEQPIWRDWDLHLRVPLLVAGMILLAVLINRRIERPLSARLKRWINP
jgi:peptidoglycan/LPS O-acetylase OafA/YrhL